MKILNLLPLVGAIIITSSCQENKDIWNPSEGPLFTYWVKHIDPEMPLPEYPRPQMVRDEWLN